MSSALVTTSSLELTPVERMTLPPLFSDLSRALLLAAFPSSHLLLKCFSSRDFYRSFDQTPSRLCRQGFSLYNLLLRSDLSEDAGATEFSIFCPPCYSYLPFGSVVERCLLLFHEYLWRRVRPYSSFAGG